MRIKRKVREEEIKNYADFILKNKKETRLKKLEETITNLGYLIKYRELKSNELLFFNG